MILEGSRVKTIRHAGSMAAHLEKEENTVVEHWESLGGSLKDDLTQMQHLTKMTQGKTGIYHVAISPRENETLTREEYEKSADEIEQKLGLDGQLRTMTYHEKNGRGHVHVCWSLVDQERSRLLDPKNDRYQLQEVAQELEREFGHEKTPRKTTEKTKEVTNADRIQETRTGLNAMERKELIAKLWQETKSGQEFVDALKSEGYLVAQGNKARVIVIDPKGGAHNLTRDLPKVIKAKQVREHLSGVELRSVEDAKAIQQERSQNHKDRLGGQKAEDVASTPEKEHKATQKAPQRDWDGILNDQKEDITETERLTRDTKGKSQASSADGAAPSRIEKRKRREVTANTLVGLMSQYESLSDQERQELREELQERLRSDQEALEQAKEDQYLQELYGVAWQESDEREVSKESEEIEDLYGHQNDNLQEDNEQEQ